MAFEFQIEYHASREEFLEKATKVHMDSLSFWKNGICALNKLLDQLTFQRDDLMSKFSQVTTEKAKLKQEYEEKIQSQVAEIAKLQNIVALLNDRLNERNRTYDQSHDYGKNTDERKGVRVEDTTGIKVQDGHRLQEEPPDKVDEFGTQDVIVLDEEPRDTESKESNELAIKQEFSMCETEFGLVANQSECSRGISKRKEEVGAVGNGQSLTDACSLSSNPSQDDARASNLLVTSTQSTTISEGFGKLSESGSIMEAIDVNTGIQDSLIAGNRSTAPRRERKAGFGSESVVFPVTKTDTPEDPDAIRSWVSSSVDDLKCYLCPRTFTTLGELERHQECHGNAMPQEASNPSQNLESTLPPTSSSSKGYSCPVCHGIFSSDAEYQRHCKMHEGSPSAGEQLPSVSLSSSIGGEQFYCSTCLKGFSSEAEWRRHQSSHEHQQSQCFVSSPFPHGARDSGYKKVHKCNACMTLFFSMEELQKHFPCNLGSQRISASQVEEKPSLVKPTPYSCSICKSVFYTELELSRHEIVHNLPMHNRYQSDTSNGGLTCQICQRNFATETDLKRHMVVHTADVTYSCDQCTEIFVCQYDLKRHYSVHTDMKNRRFKCSYCEKRFHYLKDKNRHEHVHTGYKPFQCDTCQKRFSRKDSLQTHLRTHSGEKPHHCEYCGKFFAQRSGLNSHVRSTHAGEFA